MILNAVLSKPGIQKTLRVLASLFLLGSAIFVHGAITLRGEALAQGDELITRPDRQVEMPLRDYILHVVYPTQLGSTKLFLVRQNRGLLWAWIYFAAGALGFCVRQLHDAVFRRQASDALKPSEFWGRLVLSGIFGVVVLLIVMFPAPLLGKVLDGVNPRDAGLGPLLLLPLLVGVFSERFLDTLRGLYGKLFREGESDVGDSDEEGVGESEASGDDLAP